MSEWSQQFREGHWRLQDPWRKEQWMRLVERHNMKKSSQCECSFTSCTSRHLIWSVGEDPPHPPFTCKRRRWVSRHSFGWGPWVLPLPGDAGGGQGTHLGHTSEVGRLWAYRWGNVQMFRSCLLIITEKFSGPCDLTTPANGAGPETHGKPQWRLGSNQQVHFPAPRLACLLDI